MAVGVNKATTLKLEMCRDRFIKYWGCECDPELNTVDPKYSTLTGVEICLDSVRGRDCRADDRNALGRTVELSCACCPCREEQAAADRRKA